MNFDMNFSNAARNILKKVASDERMINYQSLIFKTGDLIINNFDFLKRFGALYSLLIHFIIEKIAINEAKQEQED